MKFGARVLKTGLAAAIAMYIALSFDFTSAFFAGIAAVFSIQPSIYRSYQNIIEQIQANIIGVISAVVVVMFIGNDPLIVGFTIIIVITVCMSLKIKEETILLAIVAVIAIMESTDIPFIQFAGIRFSSIMIGILSAFIVNLVFLPPKYETKLFHQLEKTSNDLLKWIRVTSRHLSDQPSLKEEIKWFIQEITKLDHMYLLYSEERTYTKKKRYEKARKLVLFRHFIHTTKKSLEVLRTLQRLDKDLAHIPIDIQNQLITEIDKVAHNHEKLLLMCMGHIKEQTPLSVDATPNVPQLVEELMNVEENESIQRFHFLPLASSLIDYHLQLEHLAKLLTSYRQYHKNEDIKTNPHE
ncbi:FUSC family protein [Salirhabdus salicampi]|uniref:FUSC family protein n=1 Tax=Salirhabdus salicampi TaxID=476102 RepID=UPI0020C2E9C7|nr:aromatic acid exporter family protein [Salirhabdus salicampi]MCP8617970.1 aromatic acid exporter family protein [Salirhabdus salicampi]